MQEVSGGIAHVVVGFQEFIGRSWRDTAADEADGSQYNQVEVRRRGEQQNVRYLNKVKNVPNI